MPFGGRDADIIFLDSWLNNNQEAPYLLLVAPAGRGKSALLIHWRQHLLKRKDIVVVFMPISVRFRTNSANVVFAAITIYLANLHGEKITATPDTPSGVWQEMMTNYLARPLPEERQLLLILDGIDEAADWEASPTLFPFTPPKGLRVVLSARYLAGDYDAKRWLRSLGWDRINIARVMNLNLLTRDGVADVLLQTGTPLEQSEAKPDTVAGLYHLSKGDPLLVRLYVEDLWSREQEVFRIPTEKLSSIRPGLEGYFDRWWEEQRQLWGEKTPLHEPSVQALAQPFCMCTWTIESGGRFTSGIP